MFHRLLQTLDGTGQDPCPENDHGQADAEGGQRRRKGDGKKLPSFFFKQHVLFIRQYRQVKLLRGCFRIDRAVFRQHLILLLISKPFAVLLRQFRSIFSIAGVKDLSSIHNEQKFNIRIRCFQRFQAVHPVLHLQIAHPFSPQRLHQGIDRYLVIGAPVIRVGTDDHRISIRRVRPLQVRDLLHLKFRDQALLRQNSRSRCVGGAAGQKRGLIEEHGPV